MSAVVGGLEGTGYSKVVVDGEVDIYTGSALRERLFAAIDSGRHRVIMDLSGVEFMDSTGLGLLVAGQNRAQEAGGALWLVCAQKRLLRLFTITGLDQVLSIYATIEDVLAANPEQ